MSRDVKNTRKLVKTEKQKIKDCVDKLNDALSIDALKLNTKLLNSCDSDIVRSPVIKDINLINDASYSESQEKNFSLDEQHQLVFQSIVHNPVFNQLLTLPEVQESFHQLLAYLNGLKAKYTLSNSKKEYEQSDVLTLVEATAYLKSAFFAYLSTMDDLVSEKILRQNDISNKFLMLIEQEVEKIRHKKKQISNQFRLAKQKADIKSSVKSQKDLNDIVSTDVSADLVVTEQEKLLVKAYDNYEKIEQAHDDGTLQSMVKVEAWLEKIRAYYERLAKPLGVLDILDSNMYVSSTDKPPIPGNVSTARDCAKLFFKQLFGGDFKKSTTELVTTIAKLLAYHEDGMEIPLRLMDSINCNLSKSDKPVSDNQSTEHKFSDLIFKLDDNKTYATGTKTCCPNCKSNQVAVYMTLLSMGGAHAQHVDINTPVVSELKTDDSNKLETVEFEQQLAFNKIIPQQSLFNEIQKNSSSDATLSPLAQREMSQESFDCICSNIKIPRNF